MTGGCTCYGGTPEENAKLALAAAAQARAEAAETSDPKERQRLLDTAAALEADAHKFLGITVNDEWGL